MRALGRLFMPRRAGAPASPQDGEAWYDTTAGKLRARQAGVTIDLDGGSGAAVDGAFTQLVGNGVDSTFTVTHNLGTTGIIATVRKVSTGDVVAAGLNVRATSTTTAQVDFGSEVPATDEYQVTVMSGAGPQGPQGEQGPPGGSTYTTTIGDGSASSFVITHGLNSRFVDVTVRRNASPYDRVFPVDYATTVDTVTVDFGAGVVPTTNQFTVVVRA